MGFDKRKKAEEKRIACCQLIVFVISESAAGLRELADLENTTSVDFSRKIRTVTAIDKNKLKISFETPILNV